MECDGHPIPLTSSSVSLSAALTSSATDALNAGEFQLPARSCRYDAAGCLSLSSAGKIFFIPSLHSRWLALGRSGVPGELSQLPVGPADSYPCKCRVPVERAVVLGQQRSIAQSNLRYIYRWCRCPPRCHHHIRCFPRKASVRRDITSSSANDQGSVLADNLSLVPMSTSMPSSHLLLSAEGIFASGHHIVFSK